MMKREETRVLFSAGAFSLAFDTQTGEWIFLSYKSKPLLDGGNGLAAVTLLTDGTATLSKTQYHMDNVRDAVPVSGALRLASYSLRDGEQPELALTLEGGGWRVEETFLYNAAYARLERRFTVTNNTGTTALLRNVTSRMPVVSDESGCTIEMPGYPDILHMKCAQLPYGRFDALPFLPETQEPSWRIGLLGAVMPDVHMSAWMYGEELPTFWQLYKGDRGTWFEQIWQCPARLGNGDTLEIGTQYIKAGDGDFAGGLAFMHEFWEEQGIALETPTPKWAREAFIYEAFIGHKRFSRGGTAYSPYPAPEDLINDLPRIRAMGFDTLELMPRFPFPGYCVHDFYDIDVHYGPEASVKRLVDEAHSLGMRVLLDVVMHGVMDKTLRPQAIYESHPMLKEHPEFFIFTEDEQVAKTYTWSFDQKNPAFREYMKGVFCFYITELDVDGFRVDALHWNFFPNWKTGLPYPAYKTICSSFGMFAGVRGAVQAIKPDTAFYTETTGPMMANSFDLFYNYDEVWLYECLLPPAVRNQPLKCPPSHRVDMPAVDARGAAEWLDLRNKAMPRGVIKVHHADSHDTHEWLGAGTFRREYFGLKQTLALFAYCCFAEGVVMNFTGGERELEREYTELIHMRKECKALLSGSCDYLAVKCDNPRLFTLLREKDDELLLPVINFSNTHSESILDLSCLNGKVRSLLERFSGEKVMLTDADSSSFTVRLAPFGYQLWQVQEI